jgi:hypothetical protein
VRVEFEGVDMWAVLIPTLVALVEVVVVRNSVCIDAGVGWWCHTVRRGVEVWWSSCGGGIEVVPVLLEQVMVRWSF